jgi:FlaA1/EpsC-like NDP-sugar epimerase
MFENKTILITGSNGTWSREFTKQILLQDPKEIRLFSRNESQQVLMKTDFNDSRLKFIIGDIRDPKAIKQACENVEIAIHTAALKHVTICENQPREAVATNIYGVQNVIDACIENEVGQCINVSTDKVCWPVCMYSKTKAVAEGLIIDANNQTEFTDFISIRSGNIFGSSGSVVPIWIRQIKEQNYISVTGDRMRRFFITVEDAVKSTFKAMELSDRGEVFVPKMDCFYISDLAKVLVEKYGNAKTEIKSIPPFPYERDKEWLVTPEESQRTIETDDFYIVYPLINIRTTDYPKIKKSHKLARGVTMDDAEVSDMDKLRELVRKAGY